MGISSENKNTDSQKGGKMSFIKKLRGKVSFNDVIKKTKKSEGSLINAYEAMDSKTKTYHKAYADHLNNLLQLDDYVNFNGMETIFKKVIMKDNFRTGHVSRKNPLLFKNYLIEGETTPSSFRREHIMTQLRYFLDKYFASRDQMFIKHLDITDITKDNFILSVVTIENVKKKKTIEHIDYLIDKKKFKSVLTDILTEAKKHLKRPSLSVSNNNEANHNEDLFNKNRKKRQQMLDGDSDDDKSKHSNRKRKSSNNSLTMGHSIKIKHNDKHTPKHNSLKGKTRGYTKKVSKKESLMNVSYLLNNISQTKKGKSRQMLSKYMTNYQKKERNNKIAKDKSDAEVKVKAEAEEKAKLQAKAEAEARNKAYELSKLEKGDMSTEQFQKQKDAILAADFTKPVDKVESFCNNIKSKEECFQHRGKCFFTDKTQLCKKDRNFKGNNNKLNNKNLKPTIGFDFQQPVRKNDNLLGM